jgi:hypothetical protein
MMIIRGPVDTQDQQPARSTDTTPGQPGGSPDLTKIFAPGAPQPPSPEGQPSTNRNRPPWVAGGHG